MQRLFSLSKFSVVTLALMIVASAWAQNATTSDKRNEGSYRSSYAVVQIRGASDGSDGTTKGLRYHGITAQTPKGVWTEKLYENGIRALEVYSLGISGIYWPDAHDDSTVVFVVARENRRYELDLETRTIDVSESEGFGQALGRIPAKKSDWIYVLGRHMTQPSFSTPSTFRDLEIH